MMLCSTREAAEAVGLSEIELRRGFKEGRYPALLIGAGSSKQRLRWRVDLLQAAIEQEMLRRDQAEVEQVKLCWANQRRGK